MNIDMKYWTLLSSEEDLLMYYPPHTRGTYRPQPYFMPEKYPCYFREICCMDNYNGPDYAILAYIYEEEEDK